MCHMIRRDANALLDGPFTPGKPGSLLARPAGSEHEPGLGQQAWNEGGRAIEHRLRPEAGRRGLGNHRLAAGAVADADGDEPPADGMKLWPEGGGDVA